MLKPALKLLGARTRRTWVGSSTVHVEYRAGDPDLMDRFTQHLDKVARANSRIRWVEVNPYTRRVVFGFAPGAPDKAGFVAMVEDAERFARCDNAPFIQDERRHPSEDETELGLLLELLTDALGLFLGTSLKLTPLPPSSLGASIAALVGIVRTTPDLRGDIDERLGGDRADLLMNLVAALAQGMAQRPVSSLVDVVHKTALLREAQGRRQIWSRREHELCHSPGSFGAEHARLEPRPCELPPGPIEDYTDRAWLVSLAGFGVSFITTRSVQRAVGALFGGLPKPARLGREVFAAELGRVLGARGVLVLDHSVLRKLDRIDCLVLQGDLVPHARFEIGKIVTDGTISEAEVENCVRTGFDVERPIDVQQRDEFSLGPPRAMREHFDDQLRAQTADLGRLGALVLGVARGGRVVSIVEVKLIPQTGVEELISAAHQAQMRVVVSSNDDSVLQALNADDTVPEGAGLCGGIRRLQREGRGVCLVASGDSPGLPAADCGIGLIRAGEPTPWGAHMICGDDLSDVRFVLSACVMARQLARQSVNIALGAATFGALATAGGLVPMTTRRVIAIVNTATLIAMANGIRCSVSLSRRALPPPRDRTPWYALDAEGVLERLQSKRTGLSRREAIERRQPSAVPKHAIMELGEAITDEMFNPLSPLLAAGAGLSAVVGSVADAGMVGGVVVLNALIGGVQRFRTERAIRVLARSTYRRALTRRDQELIEVDVSDLVVGDIVVLSAGEVVPADCRVIEADSLEVDASSLTGESLPVPKTASPSFDVHVADRSSMLYEGTSIAAGRATAVVVAVGDQTEGRRGAAVYRRDPKQSGVELRLRSLIDLTAPIALAAGAGLVAVGLVRGRRLADLVGSGVSLAVASVPEGLPLLATAAQLAAARRLSSRGALVRNARSIEALGRVDVLCVDKTGTVTEGRIELSLVCDGSVEQSSNELDVQRARVLAVSLRATPDESDSADRVDPTDAALLRASQKLTILPTYDHAGWRPVSEVSFEAGRGYHAVLGEAHDERTLSVKGAPEVVLQHCTRWRRGEERVPLDSDAERHLSERASQLARRGLRVLAVAERIVESDDQLEPTRLIGLTFYGFVAFSDPVRPTAAAALSRLRRAGVDTLMITGDHPSTAETIATELDLLRGASVLTGAELTSLSDEELDARIEDVAVFARVTPSQKVRVVRALQRAGRVVAMVGDGTNDAPAIRLANVGIAIGEQSTAAARGAADVILTDERIETLADAIVEGRAMWSSVRDAVSILVGGNLGEIGFSLAAGVVHGKSPLNARQLLLVNLLTDVAPAMAIALRPPTAAALESLAQEGPEVSLGEALNRDIAARAVVTAAGAGSAWLIARAIGSDEKAATIALLALVGTQLGQTLISGGFTRPVLTTSIASAGVLTGIVQTPGVSHFFGCRPLGPIGWATAIGASAAATSASLVFPQVIAKAAQRLRVTEIVMASDPEALTPPVSGG